ncbi:glutathione peroxidase [Chryseobacterium sp. MEBOG06]|uniref:glutathione peroxidase n=1 Tax=unclassified Chryseobacterium TaxID=2593645 RepID=UPI001F484962|nr:MULTISPECIES: glutathione peroxidase [unclassified Chryseobacterium]UKB82043.1 glutathione peroxidase [Chryseobacterium sp. MEBOG06]
MKKILFIGMMLITIVSLSSFIKSGDSTGSKPPKSIYDFKVESIDGKQIDFSKYKGKYILIVNTASKCGYTPQYKGLEQLYKEYGDKLVIVGFPSDNFADQEFHDNVEIKSFCEKNYGVTFPLTTMVNVKGAKITPVFDYLTHKSKNGVLDAVVSWNFNKFLISPDGKLLEHFDSKVVPESDQITHYFK